MNEHDKSPATSLYENLVRPAYLIKVVCQMIIGLGLAIALVVKLYMLVLTDQKCVADAVTLGNKIRCSPALEIAAFGLALSAGFELAFLMFKKEAGEVLKPLIFGITSAYLLIASDLSMQSANWQIALVIFVLSISIGGLFYFMERFMPRTNSPENSKCSENLETPETSQTRRP